MKNYLKWLFLALVAFIPSLFITRSETWYNANPCLYTEVCQEKTLGTKKITNYGFPGSYNQHTEFTPTDSSKDGLLDLGGDRDYILIVANILFWALTFNTLYMFLARKRTRK